MEGSPGFGWGSAAEGGLGAWLAEGPSLDAGLVGMDMEDELAPSMPPDLGVCARQDAAGSVWDRFQCDVEVDRRGAGFH